MRDHKHFFETARERYQIRIKRDLGEHRPWTKDKIFQQWRFCNVHREDDRTTRWFASHVRGPLSRKGDKLKITQATTIFRWFNRVETGEKIEDLLLGDWDTEKARQRLAHEQPVVTGAYIIKGPDGLSKLDGVLYCVDNAIPELEKCVPFWGSSLEAAWEDLYKIYYLGRFMSYEIVTDLRWTPVLGNATDIMTWANAGPGCARGLGWIMDGVYWQFNPGSINHQKTMLGLMKELLEMSGSEEYWPQSWMRWEMREVEHWLCEFDKYKRAMNGERLKRRYDGLGKGAV